MPTRSPEIITRASQLDEDLVPEPWDARDSKEDRSLVAQRERYRLQGVTDGQGAGIVPAYNLNVADTGSIPSKTQDGWTRGSAGRVLGPNGKYVSRASDVPRLSYDGEDPGLLVEAAGRTNELQYSADPSQWVKNNNTSITGLTSLISGESAQKVSGTDGKFSQIKQTDSGQFTGNKETITAILEKVSNNAVYFNIDNPNIDDRILITFDWKDNTFTINAGSVLSTDYRELAKDGPNGGRVVRIFIRYDGGSSTNVNGDSRIFDFRPDPNANGGSTILHHAQIEEAPNASSPIVTGGSATTRSADNYAISVGDWWNTTEGSFLLTGTSRVFAEGNTFGNPAQRWIKHGANTAQLHYNEGILQLFDDSGNTVEVLDATAAFSPVSVGFSFTQNEMRISANGSSDNGPHDGSWLTKPSNILLGLLAVSVTFQDVSYIPRALPESTLNQITS